MIDWISFIENSHHKFNIHPWLIGNITNKPKLGFTLVVTILYTRQIRSGKAYDLHWADFKISTHLLNAFALIRGIVNMRFSLLCTKS